ncbi:hydroxymethylbilane synthase [Sphingomonas sabuli]|uniref:Porphobilinogen deaminase n=1 Tax=Sphingomonas sabuli TaxID=2764186 RepID=A0A7G9L0C8_9SPHN|nr:hydroxymethylbilane synthase [Sphingomonas sabuli]QNM82077.1 hydroxymethylbilane synthase [Sphingomonas sabuli]
MTGTPRLGTRGSPLAMIQARSVAAAMEAARGWPAGHVDIVVIKTSGDRIKDRPLAEVGGKGLWTKEIDSALLRGDVDFSVHSVKDVEAIRPDAIRLSAVMPRTDIEDILIGAASVAAIRAGAIFGTSSPRRAAQMLAARPDLRIVPLRGNVETRLNKLDAGDIDATILSSAGLQRLGLGHIGTAIPFDVMLPAPGQGAIGIECRSDDPAAIELAASIDDAASHAMVLAERAFTRALGGSCHSPVAAMATMEDGQIQLRAEILSEDGKERVRDSAGFAPRDDDAAAALARAMLDAAPPSIRTLFANA